MLNLDPNQRPTMNEVCVVAEAKIREVVQDSDKAARGNIQTDNSKSLQNSKVQNHPTPDISHNTLDEETAAKLRAFLSAVGGEGLTGREKALMQKAFLLGVRRGRDEPNLGASPLSQTHSTSGKQSSGAKESEVMSDGFGQETYPPTTQGDRVGGEHESHRKDTKLSVSSHKKSKSRSRKSRKHRQRSEKDRPKLHEQNIVGHRSVPSMTAHFHESSYYKTHGHCTEAQGELRGDETATSKNGSVDARTAQIKHVDTTLSRNACTKSFIGVHERMFGSQEYSEKQIAVGVNQKYDLRGRPGSDREPCTAGDHELFESRQLQETCLDENSGAENVASCIPTPRDTLSPLQRPPKALKSLGCTSGRYDMSSRAILAPIGAERSSSCEIDLSQKGSIPIVTPYNVEMSLDPPSLHKRSSSLKSIAPFPSESSGLKRMTISSSAQVLIAPTAKRGPSPLLPLQPLKPSQGFLLSKNFKQSMSTPTLHGNAAPVLKQVYDQLPDPASKTYV